MNWEDILKESMKESGTPEDVRKRMNALLHKFFVDMDSYAQKVDLISVNSDPKFRSGLKEIVELSESLRDKLEDFLQSYFKELSDEYFD